jgi:hypothetical protein
VGFYIHIDFLLHWDKFFEGGCIVTCGSSELERYITYNDARRSLCVPHHQIYRSTTLFRCLEGRTEESEILRGFLARRCATQPDLGANIQKGKKLILFRLACYHWKDRRTHDSHYLCLEGTFSLSFYISYYYSISVYL